MNAHKKALTLFAGLFLFSGWSLQASRFFLWRQPVTPPRAAAQPKTPAPTPRQKVELGRRLNDVVRDPAQIKKSDVKAVREAFGSDSSQMLEILRQSAD